MQLPFDTLTDHRRATQFHFFLSNWSQYIYIYIPSYANVNLVSMSPLIIIERVHQRCGIPITSNSTVYKSNSRRLATNKLSSINDPLCKGNPLNTPHKGLVMRKHFHVLISSCEVDRIIFITYFIFSLSWRRHMPRQVCPFMYIHIPLVPFAMYKIRTSVVLWY